jgi:hypothetical protein
MMRLVVGIGAWAAGTAVAVTVAWLGASVVVRNAGVGPGLPVVNAAVAPATARPTFTPPVPGPPTATATVPPTGPASPARTPSAPPSSAPAGRATATPSGPASPPGGQVHAYPLAGGTVTLDMTGGSVQLVTAVPADGYAVQTWSGTGWLRVDFSSGPKVSSLIASWYQHAPTVTVTN